MNNTIEDRMIDVDGMSIHYHEAGTGEPLLLLHGDGDDASDWQWVMPTLAQTHRVIAPDFPGAGDSAKPEVLYTAEFFARFVMRFLDRLGIEKIKIIGNSLGGQTALHVALNHPERVSALGLVDSAALGQAVNPLLLQVTLPGMGELAVFWGKTRLGAVQRARLRAALLFAHYERIPQAWIAEQERLAQIPGFIAATLSALRSQIGLTGQREVLLDQLPRLSMPTIIVWGEYDAVFPVTQAHEAVRRLTNGSLAVIPGCGHVPAVEQPDAFVAALRPFLHAQSAQAT